MVGIGGSRRGRNIGLCVGAVIGALFVLVVAVPSPVGATDSGWNIIPSPNTGPTDSSFLMSTACPNAWSCWAVGGVFSSLGNNSQPNALIDSWNGSTWSVGSDVTPPDTQASLLWSVDCVSSSDCWAVGAQEPDNQQQPVTLAENWNGSVWSVVPTPAVSGYLFSVTCSNASDCWAVGDSLDGQQNPLNGIIYHWDGSQWSQSLRASSGQTYDQFASVTCASSSDCWAVGYAGPNQLQYNFLPGIAPSVVGSAALIEHWDGTDWSIAPTPAAAAPMGQDLTSVTCSGSSDCWAVGSTMDASGNPSSSLVENWNGSTWTVTPSLDPLTPANILTAVTCLDASDCWASRSHRCRKWAEHDTNPVYRELERFELDGRAQPQCRRFRLFEWLDLCPEERLFHHRILGHQSEQHHDVADAHRAAAAAACEQPGNVDDRVRRRGVHLRRRPISRIQRGHGPQQAHRRHGRLTRPQWLLAGGFRRGSVLLR